MGRAWTETGRSLVTVKCRRLGKAGAPKVGDDYRASGGRRAGKADLF